MSDDAYDRGRDALQKWYHDECRACARAVLDEAKQYKRDESDVLHETIDGHEFIIYTAKAQLVIALSGYSDAYEDEMGERAPSDEVRAYYAMCADVREYMEALRGDDEEGNGEDNGNP
jgi:hypothetical protein